MSTAIFQKRNAKKQLSFNYTIFALNGMLALSVGLFLPFIRESRQLSYAFAGVLISFHSIGYLIASFTAGLLPTMIGRKKSGILLNTAFILAFILIAFTSGSMSVLLAFTLTGVARGANSNFCNTVASQLAPGVAWVINGLHAMFAIGAFALPLLLSFTIRNGNEYWIYMIYFMILMGIISLLFYIFIPLDDDVLQKEKKASNWGFFKQPLFYLVTGTLFFYLCAEQGVIGWLVTYFQNTGLLDEATSQIMFSVLWLMILIGRLSTTWLSTFVDKNKLLLAMGIGLVVFFTVLMFSHTTLSIMIGIMGFGLSMSGVYATAVTYAGGLIQKYAMTLSFILTFASLGPITMPTVIGFIAHHAGIRAGMASISVVLALALGFIISLLIYTKRNSKQIAPS